MRRSLWVSASVAVLVLLAVACPAGAVEQNKTVFQLFVLDGGIIGYMIVALDVASWAFIVQYLILIRRLNLLPEPIREQVRGLFEQKAYRQAIEVTAEEPSFLSQVVHAALNEAAGGYAAMERAMEQAVEDRTSRLMRKIEILNIMGNVGPMLGLLGTVYGMIMAFEKIRVLGGIPDPGQLAGSIGIALVTTLWGLIVAIPALAVYALLRNRIDELSTEAAVAAQELIGIFRPGAKKPEA